MSVLSLIQFHCRRHALAVPTAVIGSTDTTVKQLLAVLEETVENIVTEANYQVTTKEVTFTATAAEDQGAMTTLADEGYQHVLNGTFWDRSNDLPLYGPVSDVEWQRLKALVNAGPNYSYRLRGGHLLLNPAPAAPLPTIAFEYVSSWGVTDSSGVGKAAITADDDLFVFPDNILKKGLAFRWKRDKGLPYQGDETDYYDLLNKFIGREKTSKVVNLAGPEDRSPKPCIVVPSGSWLQ